VILIGNLTRDPELRYLNNGSAVCQIGLAVNRTWFDKSSNSKKEEVTFIDVTIWGRTAEVCCEYSRKGSNVLIEGRLKLDQWDDRESGQKRSKLCVVCESYTMLGSRQGGERQERYQPEDGDPAPITHQDPFKGIPDTEVPF